LSWQSSGSFRNHGLEHRQTAAANETAAHAALRIRCNAVPATATGGLRPEPVQLDGGDLQRQDIGPFHNGENEGASAFHDPEAHAPAIRQSDFPAGDNQHLIRPDLDVAAKGNTHENKGHEDDGCCRDQY
jgi:hypothetical protein